MMDRAVETVEYTELNTRFSYHNDADTVSYLVLIFHAKRHLHHVSFPILHRTTTTTTIAINMLVISTFLFFSF
ncbi:hypothetical protein Ahy_B03g062220 isoform C [Arachis hypogaea]|uniref:Uncharacterized protein n=1 Tax=Arachis hypogaea TaxID=3818 RepID=A0A444ZTJ2_ARAHY|nr:hypothetical protein Ahy_B03g062220 isoform C [Arachis hypogaea]